MFMGNLYYRDKNWSKLLLCAGALFTRMQCGLTDRSPHRFFLWRQLVHDVSFRLPGLELVGACSIKSVAEDRWLSVRGDLSRQRSALSVMRELGSG